MRPSEKGWIGEYLEMLAGIENAPSHLLTNFKGVESLDNDHKLYKLTQPSGLMYGHPIRTPGNYRVSMSQWDDREKMKMILLDSLINESLILHYNSIDNQNDFRDFIYETIHGITNFYLESEITDISSAALKKKDEKEIMEKVLDRRLKVRSSWDRNFWASYFENSLLFLDVYNFGLWQQHSHFNGSETNMLNFQENFRLKILLIIAAAAHANDSIEIEEKNLFQFFLKSANLSKEKERLANMYLKNSITLDDIELDGDASWILRKYMLELAILTVWADKQLEETEKEFIQGLARKFHFDEAELQSSLIAIESFVITNWEQVHFLQSRHDIFIIKDRFSKRIAKVVDKNKNAIVQEVRESKELMQLMVKMRREKLSETEKTKVKTQLMDILKTLPAFVVIALPGTFITLPLLLKLLPKSAFPTAFSENE